MGQVLALFLHVLGVSMLCGPSSHSVPTCSRCVDDVCPVLTLFLHVLGVSAQFSLCSYMFLVCRCCMGPVLDLLLCVLGMSMMHRHFFLALFLHVLSVSMMRRPSSHSVPTFSCCVDDA